ncbi:MAG: hypothetical protein ACRCUY_13265 [Thermoguttaceae bacterium]
MSVFLILSAYPLFFAQNTCFSQTTESVANNAANNAAENNASQLGGELLLESILRFTEIETIESSVNVTVLVDKIEFTAQGKYEEQGTTKTSGLFRSMYRFDLNFLMEGPAIPGAEPNRMTIVCNITEDREKDRIWKYRSIEGTRTLSFVRVAPIEAAMIQQKPTPKSLTELPFLGGIAGMLRQVDRVYEFKESPKLVSVGNSIPVWKLTGQIRPTILQQWAGKPELSEIPEDKWPFTAPTHIEIYLGQKDYFPHQIDYFNRLNGVEKGGLLLRTTYSDVILNGNPISASRFRIFDKGETPDGVYKAIDETDVFIRSLPK